MMEILLLVAAVVGFILVGIIPIVVILAWFRWRNWINVDRVIFFLAAVMGLMALLIYGMIVFGRIAKVESREIISDVVACVLLSWVGIGLIFLGGVVRRSIGKAITEPPLSPSEIKMIEWHLESASQRAGFHMTFEYLLSRWTGFVSEVEVGYRLTIYDYTNDLSVRDIFERVIYQVPDELALKLKRMLDPLEKRFLEATVEIDRPLLPGVEETSKWWWFRIPRVVTGELREDLEGEGFLDKFSDQGIAK